MEEYLAVINIVTRSVTRSIPYGFQARGTSEATALQEVARVALSHLCHDLTKLAQPSILPPSYASTWRRSEHCC